MIHPALLRRFAGEFLVVGSFDGFDSSLLWESSNCSMHPVFVLIASAIPRVPEHPLREFALHPRERWRHETSRKVRL